MKTKKKSKDTQMSLVEESEALFWRVFNLSPDAILVIDPHDTNVSWPIIECNVAACRMNGYTRNELIGSSIDVLNLTPGTQTDRVAYMAQLREAGHLQLETYHRRKNGSVFPVEVSTSLITIEERELVIGIYRDISKRKAVEEALHQSEERFKLMAWATKDAVWDWNLETNLIWWGEGLQKIFHYSSDMSQTDGEWWSQHIHPEDLAKVKHSLTQALEGGLEFWSKEYRFQRRDGNYAAIMDRGYILRNETGKPYRLIGAMMDITERKLMESKLIETNEQMKQFLTELQRRNRDIVLLNEMGRLLHGCQSSEEAYSIIGTLSQQLFPKTTGAIYLLNKSSNIAKAVVSWGQLPWIEQRFASHECWSLRTGQTQPLGQDRIELRCFHVSQPYPAVSHCLLMQVQGEILGILHVRSQQEEDLDDIKRQLAYSVVEQTGMALSNLNLRAALREQSIRDPLTGLYNRRYMEEALQQHLSRVTRTLHPLAIIMIDIDNFKNFNDTHGHGTGDLLLVELGHFLKSHIRAEDIPCRYGGEEFILIMPDASREIAHERAEYLRSEAKLLQVQDHDQLQTGITLSIGVAVYPFHGRTMEAVMRVADTALYRAKQEGRDRVVVAGNIT